MPSSDTDRDSRCVVVYDGDCSFCRDRIEWIRRRDAAGRLDLVPRQAPGIVERFPRLAEGDFNTGMRLIDPDGTIHVGADAVHQIARRLPRWRRLAWLYRVPGIGALSRLAYRSIAANRQSLGRSCEDDACRAASDTRAGQRSREGTTGGSR